VYLVTGGAGFIGSHIVDALVERGQTVRVVDDFSTGSRSNLAGVMHSVEILEGDLSNFAIARHAVSGVTHVIHHAAIPSVPWSVENPLGDHRSGVAATLNVLVAAREAKVSRMVYASSCAVYGELPGDRPVEEGDNLLPLSPYATSKLCGEQYCLLFHRLFGFGVVVLRYFNVFGARQNPRSEYAAAVPKFIISLLDGKPPVVFGDGEQTRDFTFVGNIVAANLDVLEHPGAPGQVFNIATGHSVSINELLRVLGELIPVHVDPLYTPPRSGDIRHSRASVRRAISVFGYRPRIDLRVGLRVTVEWFRERVGRGVAGEDATSLSRRGRRA